MDNPENMEQLTMSETVVSLVWTLSHSQPPYSTLTHTQLVHITSSAVIFPHEEKAFLYLFTSTESDVIVSIASITVSVG